MPDLAAAYRDTRESMTALVSGLSDEEARATTVPACPEWTVTDLVAHVTAIATSLATGDFPPDLNPAAFWDDEVTVRREAFVATSLEPRRDRPLADLVAEWEKSSADVEAMIRGEIPWPSWPEGAHAMPEWILVTDLAVHHHDLRGALDKPGDRDSLATGLSLRSYVEGMRFRSLVESLPPFRIVAGSREWVVGQGEPVVSVTADPFELARAASGRRSPEQVRAFDWTGDPEPVLHCFFPYGVRANALVE